MSLFSFTFCDLQEVRAIFFRLHRSLADFFHYHFSDNAWLHDKSLRFFLFFFLWDFIHLSLCGHFCIQLVGWTFFQLSSPRIFSYCLLQRVFVNWLYIWFVFLACENLTLTCAIIHPLSSFNFSNYNVALSMQTTWFVGRESCLDLFTHFLIWAIKNRPFLCSLLQWLWEGIGITSHNE